MKDYALKPVNGMSRFSDSPFLSISDSYVSVLPVLASNGVI
jgi:hypothetical protein